MTTTTADDFGHQMIDEIILEEIAKLEGVECAPGEHIPFDDADKLWAHCDRCERSIRRESARKPWEVVHGGGCRCADCFPKQRARGYAASKTERVFPEEGYEAAVGHWIWFSNSDGVAIHAEVVGERGQFFVIRPSKPGRGAALVYTPTGSVHRRYVIRRAEAPAGQVG